MSSRDRERATSHRSLGRRKKREGVSYEKEFRRKGSTKDEGAAQPLSTEERIIRKKGEEIATSEQERHKYRKLERKHLRLHQVFNKAETEADLTCEKKSLGREKFNFSLGRKGTLRERGKARSRGSVFTGGRTLGVKRGEGVCGDPGQRLTHKRRLGGHRPDGVHSAKGDGISRRQRVTDGGGSSAISPGKSNKKGLSWEKKKGEKGVRKRE